MASYSVFTQVLFALISYKIIEFMFQVAVGTVVLLLQSKEKF